MVTEQVIPPSVSPHHHDTVLSPAPVVGLISAPVLVAQGLAIIGQDELAFVSGVSGSQPGTKTVFQLGKGPEKKH